MGTNLQLDHWVNFLRGQRSTVTTAEHRALDDGRVGLGTLQTDRHLLGIGTEGVQRVDSGAVTSGAIEEVAIGLIILVGIHIGIGVGTVTATIHITADSGIDTDGITAIHRTRHVVTTVDVVDVATTNQRTCRQLVGELIDEVTLIVLILQVRTR